MHFDLEHSWFNFGILEHLSEHGSTDITTADVADKAFFNQLFHSLVCLLVSNSSSVRLHPG